jgi:hypothetical protein
MSSGVPSADQQAPADAPSPADAQALSWEALTWEALTWEALTWEALAAEALTEEALTGEALTGEALIAEARAHARRRRRRVALVVIAAAVVAAAGALIAHSGSSTSHATRAHPHVVALAARTGVVTGHLEACSGLPIGLFANDAPPVTPGTVTVLRGKESWKPAGPGESRPVLPATVVAREYIRNNYNQTFRFVLPAGKYILVGRYTHSNFSIPGPITVTAGKVLRQDVPNVCS